MKGTIVSAWIKTCKNLFGENLVNESLAHHGIDSNKVFTPTEDIEDSKALGFVDYIANKIGKNPSEVWRQIGMGNIETFSKDYPAFFRYKNLYSFLKAMYDIHVVVTRRIPGAKPPILNVEPLDKNIAVMTYSSPRGMFGYFHGMLEGASRYFNEDIQVETLEKKEDFTKISITFPEEIYNKETYRFNKLLSFGFIKNFETKVGVASLLLAGIPIVVLSNYVDKNVLYPIVLILSFVVPFIVGKGLLRPMKSIFESIEEIEKKDLSFERNISTNDFLEDIKKGECDYHFIEVMNCPDGCIGGGGQPCIPKKSVRKQILDKRNKATYYYELGLPKRESDENPSIKAIYREYLTEPLSKKAHELLHTTYFDKSSD